MKKTITVIAVLSAGAVLTIYGYALVGPNLASTGFDFSAVIQTSYFRIALLYFAMLIGIFANAIHFEVNLRAARKVRRGLLTRAFQTSGFVNAILVSPIVFYAVYKMAGEQPDDVVALCLAFQNGFFWKSVFEKKG